MSTLYQQWQNIAYDETADRSQLEKFWGTYFQIEKEIYEKLLSNPDLAFDKERLYKNMVAAKADWLYELPQWKEIFSEEELKKFYKEQKESTTIRKPKKIGRNDPCPCGSGKKYKKCCGR